MGAEFDERGWGIDGEGGFSDQSGGIEGVKVGDLGVGEGSEVMEDDAEAACGDLEGSTIGKINEVGVVVFEVLELVEGVAIEEAGKDGEEVEALACEIDTDGEGEPAAGGEFEGSLHFVVGEVVDVVAKLGVDLDLPTGVAKFRRSIGTKPRPEDGGGGEVGLGEPAAFGGVLGGLLFGEGEEEAVGWVGREGGEAEGGEELDGAELGRFVPGDGGGFRGLDEGEFVLAVVDGGTGGEPGVAVGCF